ncbi:MAG: YigZ family protein [Lachnospiraceae bacterium]|nr:YigZ family protein [Lachnospiraceae bacterium]
MAGEYKTIAVPGDGNYEEKKSRFLGEAVHVESQEEAEAYVASVRKKYYDARHHCWAYVAGVPGTPEEVVRSSDDGEPSGTAGRPILEILTGHELHRSLIVVTRYFGGTLLGTGGLVRSYTNAARAAFENSQIVRVLTGTKIRISCSYPAYGKLEYLFLKDQIQPRDIQYGEGILFTVTVPADQVASIQDQVTETTSGQGKLSLLGTEEIRIPV